MLAMQFAIAAAFSIAIIVALGAPGAKAMGGCGHKVTPEKSPYAILEPQTVARASAPGYGAPVPEQPRSGSDGGVKLR
jgi:hypothetical protein